MEVRTSSVAFSKTNTWEGRNAGEENDAGVATLGGVRLFTLRLNTGTVAVESILYGRRSEKSRYKVVEGKRLSISLAVTVERNVKNSMSANRFAIPKTKVSLSEESRNPMPWRLSTWKRAWRIESTIRSASCSAEPVGNVKYAVIVAVKSLRETEREKERERIRRKIRMRSSVSGTFWRWCQEERSFGS